MFPLCCNWRRLIYHFGCVFDVVLLPISSLLCVVHCTLCFRQYTYKWYQFCGPDILNLIFCSLAWVIIIQCLYVGVGWQFRITIIRYYVFDNIVRFNFNLTILSLLHISRRIKWCIRASRANRLNWNMDREREREKQFFSIISKRNRKLFFILIIMNIWTYEDTRIELKPRKRFGFAIFQFNIFLFNQMNDG